MPIPLRDRPLDWFFILGFTIFAGTSFGVDTMPTLGMDAMRDLLTRTYADCDPMFMRPPPFLYVAATVSGFIWGPLYLYFVWSFVRGRNQVRPFALVYAGALTLAMCMIFAEELWSFAPGWASPRPLKFTAYNLPYLLMPILLGVRMRSPFPFGGTTPG